MITLIDYWRSGTSHRTRIALHLKSISFAHQTVDLRMGQHKSPAFLAINPQGLVPALIVDGVALSQSPAILEWLEEAYPAPALLPAEPVARAQVRALASVVACDIHPLGNMRVLASLKQDHGQPDAAVAAFARRWIVDGFAALDAMLARSANEHGGGDWSWGATPTLADCCIVPQVFAAISRYGVDLSPWPQLSRVYAAAEHHPAFIAAHPLNQQDAPQTA